MPLPGLTPTHPQERLASRVRRLEERSEKSLATGKGDSTPHILSNVKFVTFFADQIPPPADFPIGTIARVQSASDPGSDILAINFLYNSGAVNVQAWRPITLGTPL